jgi:hypothetical protein
MRPIRVPGGSAAPARRHPAGRSRGGVGAICGFALAQRNR